MATESTTKITSDRRNCALAVFVKTPELSPVKTRLARQIGAKKARAVYEQSLLAVAEIMRQVANEGVSVFWAVGETAAVNHRRWRAFPAVFTGDGELGARLHNIYSSLKKTHRRIALIGSDSPQLSPQTIIFALQQSRGKTVVGTANDGGFYLFAAARKIAARVWTPVEYSRPDTLAQLEKNLRLESDYPILHLPPLDDIDDKQSLQKVIGELKKSPSAAQKKIAQSLSDIIKN